MCPDEDAARQRGWSSSNVARPLYAPRYTLRGINRCSRCLKEERVRRQLLCSNFRSIARYGGSIMKFQASIARHSGACPIQTSSKRFPNAERLINPVHSSYAEATRPRSGSLNPAITPPCQPGSPSLDRTAPSPPLSALVPSSTPARPFPSAPS